MVQLSVWIKNDIEHQSRYKCDVPFNVQNIKMFFSDNIQHKAAVNDMNAE
jgi:hypothetical protein